MMSFASCFPLYGGGFSVAFVQLFVFYYLCAIALHCLLRRFNWFPKLSSHGLNKPHEPLRDALSSLGPITVKAFVWYVVEQLYANDHGRLYEIESFTYGEVGYWMLVILVLDFVHDTWFYWTHRWLHTKTMYKHIHYVHHKYLIYFTMLVFILYILRSHNPTAFTGYSMHSLEALIVFTNEILVCFLIPMPIALHRIYHIFTTFIHIGGHESFEISSMNPTLFKIFIWIFDHLQTKKVSKDSLAHSVFTTVKHHNMHHSHPTSHFALYFCHWDRWLGTLHPTYKTH